MKRKDEAGLVRYDVEAEGLTGLTTLFTSFHVHVKEGAKVQSVIEAAKRCLDRGKGTKTMHDFDGKVISVTFLSEPGYLTIKKTPNGPRS